MLSESQIVDNSTQMCKTASDFFSQSTSRMMHTAMRMRDRDSRQRAKVLSQIETETNRQVFSLRVDNAKPEKTSSFTPSEHRNAKFLVQNTDSRQTRRARTRTKGAFDDHSPKPIANSDLTRSQIRQNQQNRTQTYFPTNPSKGAPSEKPSVSIE